MSLLWGQTTDLKVAQGFNREMTEAERLRLRFALEAVVRFGIARIPRAPRRPFMRFTRVNGHPSLRASDIVVAEALAAPLNEIGLGESDQYAALRACFEEFPRLRAAIQAPNEDPSAPPVALLALAIRFIIVYVANLDGVNRFSDEVFSTLFDRFVNELDLNGWRWVRRTPLHNFIVPADAPQSVEIGSGITIRPVEESERDGWHNSSGPDQLRWPTMANITHLIEIAYERPRYVVSDISPDRTEDDVVFILKMCGSDIVAFGITEQRLDSVWNVSGHYPNFRLPPNLSEEKYTFDAASQALFERYYSSFVELIGQQRFQFAKRRYSDGCGRLIDEDRVVDFWIAVETLFSNRRDSNIELRERLSARLAAFVEANLDMQAQVFAELFASYRDRSEIVHGGLRRTVTSDSVEYVRPHVKAALRRVLDDRRLPNLRILD